MPDLDELIRQAQEQVRRFLPGGAGRAGGRGLALLALLVVALWGASGIFRVQPDELGVVMRFGAFTRMAGPGLNYHLPWPVEQVMTPRVTRINRIDIGFRGDGDLPTGARIASARDVLEESLMLTGDENIVDIDFTVFWRIRDAADFLFNTRSPEATIKSAAESVMREVIGRTPIQPAMNEARAQIEQAVRAGTQAMLDGYHAGVEITQVQAQKTDPPAAVIEAFNDVQRAGSDRERARNEAQSYRNDIVPRARGEGQRLVQEATGYRESQVTRARGEAARFTSVLEAYNQAQDITLRRLYLETMEDILRRNPKLVVDDRLQGMLPLLNLNPGDGQGVPGVGQPAPPRPAPALTPPPAARSSMGSGR
jgi:membrane protease subunit HflK